MKLKTKKRNNLVASLWKHNNSHYEVIISISSDYRPTDSHCENHIFDSLKRANSFYLTV